MKKFLSARKKKAIIATVAAGICLSGGNAEAVEQFNIDWDGKTIFNVKYYGASDYTAKRAMLFNDGVKNDLRNTIHGLNYDLTNDIKTRLNEAFKWWAEILGPGANISQPAQYFVGTYSEANAGATPLSLINGTDTTNPNLFKEIFQSGQNVTQYDDIDDFIINMENLNASSNDNTAFGRIIIGQYLALDESNDGGYGFIKPVYYASPTPIYMLGADIGAVMFHEIGHSLGIGAPTNNFSQKIGDTTYNMGNFKDFDEKDYTAHLYDQYGTQATPYAVILASKDNVSVLNQYLEENPDKKSTLSADNIFVVDNSKEARNSGKVYLYFVGDNVTEVLNGRTFTRADGEQISGLPINLWEGTPEFSHIDLERSMMSHQSYRSYVNFMEAELALIQDIGYDIDRRNFYGRSIYNNGVTLTNYQGYSKRENGEYVDGYNNSTLGVGLHVYGSNNNITQAGNIFANGEGAAGVRVDGINNTITVAKGTEIHADGNYNDGVLIAYGKNHNVNIEGTVTATGESSNALSFNFGSNALSSDMEYRGSFMRYHRLNYNNQVLEAKNLGFNEIYRSNDAMSFTDLENGDLNAPMVNTANISGKLVADSEEKLGYAIYIDPSAFVDTININDGAEITGNIMSQWKHFGVGVYDYETPVDSGVKHPVTGVNGTLEGLKLQYNGGQYLYTKYIPDLVTKLNFNNTMYYSGDIDGMDNMKMNVNGNLIYGGAADVVNVNVANGAGLFGGTYTVNDMTDKIADGFSDDTTGKFYNHGTISNVTINGDLVSDGTLSGEAGKITVNGAANVDGSTVISKNVLPDETAEILTAENISGNISNTVDNPEKVSGLLNGYGEISNNKITYTAKTANNIGALNDQQAAAFNAVKNMSTNLTADRKSELLPIYNLNVENAGRALSQIGNNDAAQLLSAAQQSTVANRVISDRLNTAFSSNVINFNVGANNFADGDNENILMGVSANYNETADNNFWVKFTKNWGELKGGANYHGSAISGGYDRAFGENWRAGLFVSYNATSLASDNSGGSAYDTRGGIYGGYHNDVDDAFIYIDAGKVRNKLNRSISALGLGAEAKYNSNIFEIGGEYKRNLTPEKIWSVSPFVNLQYSRLKQKAYNETGAGIYNQQVNSKSNGYFAGTLGVEFKRVLANGNYAARIGVKHAFTGADPELNFSYEGNGGNFYTLKNNQDKTHFILSIGGENHFKGGWILGGDVGWQKGSHDKDLTASVMLRKIW